MRPGDLLGSGSVVLCSVRLGHRRDLGSRKQFLRNLRRQLPLRPDFRLLPAVQQILPRRRLLVHGEDPPQHCAEARLLAGAPAVEGLQGVPRVRLLPRRQRHGFAVPRRALRALLQPLHRTLVHGARRGLQRVRIPIRHLFLIFAACIAAVAVAVLLLYKLHSWMNPRLESRVKTVLKVLFVASQILVECEPVFGVRFPNLCELPGTSLRPNAFVQSRYWRGMFFFRRELPLSAIFDHSWAVGHHRSARWRL